MTDVTRYCPPSNRATLPPRKQLLPLVYDELRKLAAARMAQEKPGQTFQATALVHEAYVRLVDDEEGSALGQPGTLLGRRGRSHAADSGGEGSAKRATEAWR